MCPRHRRQGPRWSACATEVYCAGGEGSCLPRIPPHPPGPPPCPGPTGRFRLPADTTRRAPALLLSLCPRPLETPYRLHAPRTTQSTAYGLISGEGAFTVAFSEDPLAKRQSSDAFLLPKPPVLRPDLECRLTWGRGRGLKGAVGGACVPRRPRRRSDQDICLPDGSRTGPADEEGHDHVLEGQSSRPPLSNMHWNVETQAGSSRLKQQQRHT